MGQFIEGIDRHQAMLLPECLDDYVGEDSTVRAIDAFVEMLIGQQSRLGSYRHWAPKYLKKCLKKKAKPIDAVRDVA